jgi:hypothetical protein
LLDEHSHAVGKPPDASAAREPEEGGQALPYTMS